MFTELPPGTGRIYLLSADTIALLYRREGGQRRIEFPASPVLTDAFGHLRQADVLVQDRDDDAVVVSFFRPGASCKGSAPPRCSITVKPNAL